MTARAEKWAREPSGRRVRQAGRPREQSLQRQAWAAGDCRKGGLESQALTCLTTEPGSWTPRSELGGEAWEEVRMELWTPQRVVATRPRKGQEGRGALVGLRVTWRQEPGRRGGRWPPAGPRSRRLEAPKR